MEWAICWQQEQWAKCPGCGNPRDEAWGADAEENWRLSFRWDAEIHACAACEASETARRKAAGDSGLPSYMYPVLIDRDRET